MCRFRSRVENQAGKKRASEVRGMTEGEVEAFKVFSAAEPPPPPLTPSTYAELGSSLSNFLALSVGYGRAGEPASSGGNFDTI